MADAGDMMMFAKVVEAGSITGGAKLLGLRKSTVSRRITLLEERLSVRLLERNTRHLRLTEAGNRYYQHCVRVAAEAEAAEAAVTQLQTVPSGTLRVTAAFPEEQLVGPVMAEFLEVYHQVHIELHLSDQYINLVDESIDVALRVGPLIDSSLVARRLMLVNAGLYASPAYIRHHQQPSVPQELGQHHCIGYGDLGSQIIWELRGPDTIKQIKPMCSLIVNSLSAARETAIAGLGIALLPHHLCRQECQQQLLQPILPQWSPKSRELFAIYPSNRHLAAKVRAFIDFMAERLPSSSPSD